MDQRPSAKKSRALILGGILGAVLTVVAGLGCLLRLGDGLTRLSYDLPFLFSTRIPDELVMVYIDDKVKLNLGQSADIPLGRQFHSKLVQRLTDEGAKLVLYDILFDTPGPDPAADEQFAQALRRNGKAVLVAGLNQEVEGNVIMDSPQLPMTNFTAVANWGSAKVVPDPDTTLRSLYPGDEDIPSVSWAAADLLGAAVTKNPGARQNPRWLNYYCRPGDFHAVDLDHAIETNGLPPGYFHNKIVVVGARPSLGLAGASREEFSTPFTRFDLQLSTGPSIQALSLLNLLHGDWLERLSSSNEKLLVIAWGIIISLLLLKFRPWLAILIGPVCALVFAFGAMELQLHRHLWFAWAIPVAVQTPIAVIWSVGYQYLVASRKQRQLRRAFGAYLSPYMAARIANSEFDLALGGREVEASVMFTDLEGFTKMSELLPPSEVSGILTTYFNQTTSVILEQEGTIIKYIGDAVMAVWGAPLPEERHAQRAVLAAWGMSQAAKQEVMGRRLRTRIGVNTGLVLAGNLGSDFRFDYTCIGDTTNFAARLEGLNKYLGTDVLISEFTAAQLDGGIKLRPLGRFIAAGKKQAIGIFEVIGMAGDFAQDPPWFTAFAAALDQFQRGELGAAEAGFQKVKTLRDGKDGPSEFYLKYLAKVMAHPEAREAWDGAVRLDEK